MPRPWSMPSSPLAWRFRVAALESCRPNFPRDSRANHAIIAVLDRTICETWGVNDSERPESLRSAAQFPLAFRAFRGGEGGIRTHGAHRSAVFKTAAFNRSATSPSLTGMTLRLGHSGTRNFTIGAQIEGCATVGGHTTLLSIALNASIA